MALVQAVVMKMITTLASGLVLSALFAGCSGGGGGSTTPTPISPGRTTPTATPAAGPTATPTTAAAPLATATVNGSPGFVTSTGMATYFFDGDTVADQSNCTAGCLAVWPAVAAPAGTLPSPWSSFKRTDTGTIQLAYNGKPLYTIIQDTTPGVATGDGFEGFSIARPAAATPTPAPTNPPVGSPYAVRRLPH